MSLKVPSTRRVFLGASLKGMGALLAGCGVDGRSQSVLAANSSDGDRSGAAPGGAGGGMNGTSLISEEHALGSPDAHGIRLPPGYSVRVIATSGERVLSDSNSYVWHSAPDGGATFAVSEGGWIYVSNSEVLGAGGVGALVFDANAGIIDAYSILFGTTMNCQGGATPWGTWLSCEEVTLGKVYECDPGGKIESAVRPALGVFRHEGLTYDETTHYLYMTEDEPDGGLYRFVPEVMDERGADLSQGRLEIARVLDGRISWVNVPDPTLQEKVPTRYQVEKSQAFNGGEGIWWQDNEVLFTTKGDDRVWSYSTIDDSLRVLYDPLVSPSPILSGVDDILKNASGEIFVAEDQGDMQIVMILATGEMRPLLQVTGQETSEITGLAFDPSGTRLYFSSQRGITGQGITYEVTGPFSQS